ARRVSSTSSRRYFFAPHGFLAAQGFFAAHGLAFWARAAGAAPRLRTATTERAPRVLRVTRSPPSGAGMGQSPWKTRRRAYLFPGRRGEGTGGNGQPREGRES